MVYVAIQKAVGDTEEGREWLIEMRFWKGFAVAISVFLISATLTPKDKETDTNVLGLAIAAVIFGTREAFKD